MNRLRCSVGQTVIELAFAIPVVALVIAGGACIFYLCFAKAWMSRAAREAAVCLQSPRTKFDCRSRLERTLRSGLPFGEFAIDIFQKLEDRTTVRIVLQFVSSPYFESTDQLEASVSIRNLK